MPAQYQLAQMYYDGIGVPQDYSKAFKWFEYAARNTYFNTMDGTWSKGGELAQYYLGMMYHKGLGVDKNKAMAKEWLDFSCGNNYQASCNYMQNLSK